MTVPPPVFVSREGCCLPYHAKGAVFVLNDHAVRTLLLPYPPHTVASQKKTSRELGCTINETCLQEIHCETVGVFLL